MYVMKCGHLLVYRDEHVKKVIERLNPQVCDLCNTGYHGNGSDSVTMTVWRRWGGGR